MKEQWQYIPRIQLVFSEMQKDPKSVRLYNQIKGPLEKMIKAMQPKKSLMTKIKDMFLAPEPKLWDEPEQQWTPEGIQEYVPPAQFKTSRVHIKMAQIMAPMAVGEQVQIENHNTTAGSSTNQQTDNDFLSKVSKEVEQLRNDGLMDIDIKQAIFKKYGPEVMNKVFAKDKPSSKSHAKRHNGGVNLGFSTM
jgi:hypothetical protein